MARYILQRFIQLIIVLIIVSILIFLVVRIAPIDPIASITKGKAVSEETIASLEAEYNLDKSLPEQYINWITGIFEGDFGKSFQYREGVTELLLVRYPITLQLVVMSAILVVLVAIPLGILGASRRNGAIDQTLTVTSLVLVSSPSFFTGILLMLLFTLIWPIFPTFGTGHDIVSNIKYLFLPAVSLAAVKIALTMRITRSNMVEQLTAPYIQTAVAKGLYRGKVVYKHALKNAFIPILTVASLEICGMMGGAVMVEKVFSINGVGSLLVDAVNKADYPVTQSITLILVTIFMVCNLIVDILYAVVDPRIRLK